MLRRACMALLMLFASLAPARAQLSATGFPLELSNFVHTAWSRGDGAPAPILHLAQTSDGILYLAGSDGVYRFDGINFDRIPAPKGSTIEHARPTRLLATQSGDLWIGYGGGAGVGVLHNGRISALAMPRPPSQVTVFAQTRDGTIFVAFGGSDHRLSAFRNGQWLNAEEPFGLPAGQIESLSPASDGSLWISLVPNIVVRLPPGGTHFLPALTSPERGTIAFDRMGQLWAFGPAQSQILLDRHGQPPTEPVRLAATPKLRHIDVAFDAWGGIWGSTRTAALFRIPAARPGTVGPVGLERFDHTNGLTADATNDVLTDREGNIWVATNHGLDRFRRAAIASEPRIPGPDINGLAIARSADGTVYIQSSGELFSAAPGDDPKLLRSGLGDGNLICPARHGGIWVASGSRLTSLGQHDARDFIIPDAKSDRMLCFEDQAGRIWIATSQGNLWHDAAGWHTLSGLPGTGDVWAMASGPGDETYFSVSRKILVRRTPAGTSSIGPETLRIGDISGIANIDGTILVWGTSGLIRLHDGRIERSDTRMNPWTTGIRTIVDAGDGTIWIQGRDGIASAPKSNFSAIFRPGAKPLDRHLFDAHDGAETFTQSIGYGGAQMAAGPDGRIWFLSTDGVFYVNSKGLPFNPLPPPVFIHRLESGDRILRDPVDPILPAGTRSLDIAFSAYSLTMPEEAQLRYRLDGVDTDWVDPGKRRLASYTNLSPGNYVFHVVAANNDGVWNHEGATLHFRIEPTFFQSVPFFILCGLEYAAVLWLGYTLRVKAVASQISLRLSERMNERERIARELHDTLLQGVSALMLRFQQAAETMPEESETRRALEKALDIADDVVLEGRERIRELRLFDTTRGLDQTIMDTPGRNALGPGVRVSVSSEGDQRPLVPLVASEIVGIVNEALNNIAQHAHASSATVHIDYRPSTLVVSISDNGVGIDEAISQAGQLAGHFGLPGMFERARRICAKLEVMRAAPGTRIVLTVPTAGIFA